VTGIGYDATVTEDAPGGRASAELRAFAAVRASLMLQLAGARLGRYDVGRKIGGGAMGVVYRGHDSALSRDVAIKLVRGDDSFLQAALVTEARALASFSHPHVLTILDVGSVGRDVYLVTELVDGSDLRKWLRVQTPTRLAVLDVLLDAGAGLAAAHEHGLVHRDVKPDNLLVGSDGRVRVADFGLAVSAATISTPTSGASTEVDTSVRTAGTPAYMAPEQHRGVVTAASDQFAFCVTAIEALGEVAPFEGRSLEALYAAKLRPVARPRRIPRRWWRVLSRGLAVDPAARWPSMRALLDALTRARRTNLVPVGLVAATTIIAAAIALPAAAPRGACAQTDARIAAVWSRARAERLRTTFVAIDDAHGDAIATAIDDELKPFVATWTEAQQRACAIDRPTVASSCADRQLLRVDAVLTTLERARASDLGRAIAAVRRAVRDTDCSETTPALEDPSVGALLGDLERVVALGAAGRVADAERLATEVHARASTIGDRALFARAGVNLGVARSNLQRHPEAAAAFGDAFHRLPRGHDDALAVRAALGAATAHANAGDVEAARQWLRHARGRMTAAALDELEPDVAHAEGIVATLAGDHATGVARLSDALALREASGDSLRICDARHELAAARVSATVYGAADMSEADAEVRGALASCVAALGEQHPDIASLHDKLGVLSYQRGLWSEAVVEHDRALAIYEHTDPTLVRARANAWLNRGLALGRLAQHDTAAQSIRIALELYRMGTAGARELDTGRARLDLALAVRAADRRDEALVAAQAGLDDLQVVLPPGHPMLAVATANVAELLGELGRDDEAVQWGERAIAAIATALGEDHDAMAMARANLARVLARRGDAPRAIALFEAALAAASDSADGREIAAAAARDLGRLRAAKDLDHAPAGDR
jgi:tetratricopeptide (TPR) repeat protein